MDLPSTVRVSAQTRELIELWPEALRDREGPGLVMSNGMTCGTLQ